MKCVKIAKLEISSYISIPGRGSTNHASCHQFLALTVKGQGHCPLLFDFSTK